MPVVHQCGCLYEELYRIMHRKLLEKLHVAFGSSRELHMHNSLSPIGENLYMDVLELCTSVACSN